MCVYIYGTVQACNPHPVMVMVPRPPLWEWPPFAVGVGGSLVCMHACMYICMYVCMDGWMDVWMYGCMYACMYVCMYVCN